MDFHSFHRKGGKILVVLQVICNMPFLMPWEGHEMGNKSAPGGGGVKQHSSGIKHFLERVKKNLGGI